MTIKSLILSVLTTTSVAASAASAAVYLEARAAILEISGTPSIGDPGKRIGDNLPGNAFTIACGYDFNPSVSLEARFTHIGDIDISKAAPLIPTEVESPAPSIYFHLQQSTDLYTLALPLKVLARGAFSVSVSPLAHLECSEYSIAYAGVDTPVPTRPLQILVHRTRHSLRVGGEVKAAYRLSKQLAVDVSYSYSNLQAYGAHLIGAGLSCHF